jgi:hypothetical protein
MKVKNPIFVVCAMLTAAGVGAMDWNNPQLASVDLNAIEVAVPKAELVRTPPSAAKDVTLQALKFDPKNYNRRTVRTVAVLENACASYFKPCFVLQSGRGTPSFVTVPVWAWLPLTAAGSRRPPIMSDLLDKKLRLVGELVLVGVPSKKQKGYRYQFRVHQYEIIKK